MTRERERTRTSLRWTDGCVRGGSAAREVESSSGESGGSFVMASAGVPARGNER